MNNFTDKNSNKEKRSYSFIWVTLTVLLCLFFGFAPVSGIFAQSKDFLGRDQGTSTKNSQRFVSIIQNVYDFIQQHYIEEVDPKVLFEGAMKGMFNALEDPYTSFLAESEMTDLNDTTQGSFGGVGLYITKPLDNENMTRAPYVEIASPIEDTPGWRAGINPGDLMIEINGEPTDKLTMDEVLARLRGTPGVEVQLLIRRGEKLEFPVTLTREIIEVPNTKFALIDNIGYLRLITFTPMTAQRAQEAIEEFKKTNYKALILDLRNNYGGLLSSAVDICSLFIDGDTVVSTKSRIPSENYIFKAKKGAVVPQDMPIIVLINRGSASASEIVAGALKDRHRAYLVGEKTFGKGSVQQVYPIDTVGFKITTARYYTPSDVNIDKIGIPPDREVLYPEFTEADVEKLTAVINGNKIPEYIAKNPQATSMQIEEFAKELENEYQLDITLLKRLIRNEQNRTEIAPVYDLEYDIQLQEAVRILRNGEFEKLMETSKSLKELQDEVVSDLPLAS